MKNIAISADNYVDTVLCYNLAELLGIIIKLSSPSFCPLSVFPPYTSSPELHPNCSDSVGLIQPFQCYRMHCEDRTQGQLCYFRSNFVNACQMTEVPYLFIFKPLWQELLGLSIKNYFARCL